MERRFPEDGGMKRAPADVLAVGHQLVLRPHSAAVCFTDGKQGIRQRHRGLVSSQWRSYTLARS
jgi:hypothetical protein